MTRFRWPLLLALLGGLAIAGWVIASVGLHDIVTGIARIGSGGFLLLCLCSFGLSALLGAAWLAAMPGEPATRLPLFAWARIVREGASDLLPFSQIGGIIVGTRTLIKAGLAPPRVYAAMIVDLTTEMIAQLLFTLYGLWILGTLVLAPATAHAIRPLAWGGGAVAVAVTLAFLLLQRPALRFAGAMATRLVPGSHAAVDQVLAALADVYRRRRAVLWAFLFNLLAWLASAACAWLILWLMGAKAAFGQVVALESLIFAVRSAAFVIPGALGVQEAVYMLLAPAFGLPAEAVVGLSLIKRARDVAIGLPALVIWQGAAIRSGSRARRPA